ncbi:MAG TPA: NAD(P)(+) transhydrogenase (Re/Si-specific) subunit beta [Deltaproteobacteria bacterium]|nr:NAD(P)(+) transhydrogenase (Re/Si-specific) subunit beta [Deltaproteobacteria bacterium]
MANLLTVAYLAAAALFILSLGGLSNQETARRGNLYGMIGMGLAIVATLLDPRISGAGYGLVAGAVILGGAIGAGLAARVAMTSMPELVALLHSFVGLSAVLVGISTALHPGEVLSGAEKIVHDVEIFLDVGIGAITLTGSVVAWAKLSGRLSGAPLLLPGRHLINLLVAGGSVALVVPFSMDLDPGGLVWLLGMTGLAGLLGVHLVAAIGGADMPVVVSLLNSYSGWTAAAAGFMLGNDLLIVTGALVGSSGAILSYIMCRAMNRSIWNVVFGGFGTDAGGGAPAQGDQPTGEIVAIELDEAAALLARSKRVILVPGYGMAVAQAQHAVQDFTTLLRGRGVEVRFGIHPVAGRLPGHMNVLLAEAGVPYDIVLEMDEINDDLPDTDVCLVIGANDIVNPSAQTDQSSPIYGMPVLEAWEAATCIVLKRSMRAGYAGVGNPLFLHPHTRMLFGDARDTMSELVARLKQP